MIFWGEGSHPSGSPDSRAACVIGARGTPAHGGIQHRPCCLVGAQIWLRE